MRERLVSIYPVEEVESRSDAEEDARAAGLQPRDVEAIWARARALYRTGLYPAVGLCVRRRGRVILDRALGHARGNAPGAERSTPKDAATPATLYNIFSTSKAITAMLVHLLDQEGLLHINDPIDEYLPGFGRHGKRWVTIHHVLTHRAGVPSIPQEHINLDLLHRPDQILDLLCDAKPTWAPGRRLAYHALTGGYILGAVIEAVTGRPIREVLAERILNPLGFSHLNYGVSTADLPRVAESAFTGPPVLWPVSSVMKRVLGVTLEQAITLSNDPRFLSAVVPAGNIVATANEVSRFFELLLRGGTLDGHTIFQPRTIRRALAEHTYFELDLTFMVPVRYGLGVMLGAPTFSLYGPNTPRAFGHLGFTNILGYADPERDISVCIMTSGKPFLTPRLIPFLALTRELALRCSASPVAHPAGEGVLDQT
jgi:CubicO group peptidase (beta-lactamase class C family)